MTWIEEENIAKHNYNDMKLEQFTTEELVNVIRKIDSVDNYLLLKKAYL